MGTRALAFIMLAAALAAASCSRSERSSAAPAKSTTPPPTADRSERTAAAAQPMTSSVQPARQPATTPAKQTAAPSPPTPVRAAPVSSAGVTGLLVAAPASPILPEDFLIGPLACLRELEGDERAAISAAQSLLASFARGSVERSLLAPGSRDALAGSLAWAIERGTVPVSWRIGRPRRAGGELAANLRLLGAADASAEGELFLAREGGAWAVTDFQLNAADLAVARAAREHRFVPSPYRWLLGE